MKYLVKDLSRISGLTPARIRKWQQRYKIFRPETGDNGYHYYTNDDLLVLTHIKRGLDQGRSLREIIEPGRDKLISQRASDVFESDDVEFIALVAAANFESIRRRWDREHRKQEFNHWVNQTLREHVVLVGRAWQEGYLSVAEEHAFSRWVHGYFSEKLKAWEKDDEASILVVTFPGEEHELGALFHHGLLLNDGARSKFCGHLDEADIIKELVDGDYQELSISVVIPRNQSELDNLEKRVKKRFPAIKVSFGGGGVGA